MKDKRSLYILLPAAAALWGYIIYLVVSGMGSDSDIAHVTGQPIVFADSLVLAEDSFSLSLAYDDPFLKKMKPLKTVNTNPNPSKRAPKPKPKPLSTTTINWPSISFGGSIAGGGTKKEVIILTIGNDEVLAKEGDVVKGVKIVHIAPNAIGLEYQGATKTISR